MNIVSLQKAIELIMEGAIGVIPTDTVYGLVASAHNKESVERFYALKSRDKKPGTLIASRIEHLHMIGVAQSQIDTVAAYWPNPISAVLVVDGHEYLHQGVGTLAMRVTANPRLRELLDNTGPIITSSANQPGKPMATSIEEANNYFGERVDFYVDGGVIAGVPASTIIRPSDDGIQILRQGGFTL
jgi:L-threonylcarbamoyladenylate synthase